MVWKETVLVLTACIFYSTDLDTRLRSYAYSSLLSKSRKYIKYTNTYVPYWTEFE